MKITTQLINTILYKYKGNYKAHNERYNNYIDVYIFNSNYFNGIYNTLKNNEMLKDYGVQLGTYKKELIAIKK